MKKIIISLTIISFLLNGCAKIEKKPNILFCLADDASYHYYNSKEHNWINTPNMDRVAENGIVFQNAYTPNAKCAPSRACILTGRYSWQLEEAGNHFGYWPQEYKSVTEILGENNYFTGYTGKGWEPGDPGEINGKRRELLGQPFQDEKITPPTPSISNTNYSANFKTFLHEKPKNKPFFFWFGSLEPHRSYTYQSGINQGNKTIENIKDVPEFWPDTDSVKTDMLDYAFELEHYDKMLGEMLQILEDNGELENTIIILTADNGMPFPRVKGQCYELSNHLPLVISWINGKYKKNTSITDYISFVDFAPTFLDIAGIDGELSGMKAITGKSFKNILMGKSTSTANKHVLIGKERHDVGRPFNQGYPIRGIVKDSFLYVKNFEIDRWPSGNPETGYLNCDASPTKTEILKRKGKDGTFNYWQYSFGKRPENELYNIKKDPYCMNNLASELHFSLLISELNKELEAELIKQKDPRMFGNGAIFDQYPVYQEKYLNYYEKFKSGEAEVASWIIPSDIDNSF